MYRRRRDCNNSTPLLGLHAGDDLLAHRRHGDEVQLKCRGIGIYSGLSEVARRRTAGVGHQNVDATKRFGRVVDELFSPRPGRQIANDGNRTGDLRYRRIEATLIAPVDYDLAAGVGECDGRGKSES